MTRHITSRFVAAAAVLLLPIAGPLLAAERAGGMRQQPLDPPAGRSTPRAPEKPPPRQPGVAGGTGWGASRISGDDRQKADSASITYRGTRYLVTQGRWYERRGKELLPVAAPVGVMVQDLPEGYSMRWVGGVPYFYADGLYYVWRERKRRYEILQAPADVETPPASSETRPEVGREGVAPP